MREVVGHANVRRVETEYVAGAVIEMKSLRVGWFDKTETYLVRPTTRSISLAAVYVHQ
jgi:hypothetical protein